MNKIRMSAMLIGVFVISVALPLDAFGASTKKYTSKTVWQKGTTVTVGFDPNNCMKLVAGHANPIKVGTKNKKVDLTMICKTGAILPCGAAVSLSGTKKDGSSHTETTDVKCEACIGRGGEGHIGLACESEECICEAPLQLGCSYDLGADCSGPGCVECTPDVPTVSEWGVVVMTVLVLTAGTVVLSRRRRRVATA